MLLFLNRKTISFRSSVMTIAPISIYSQNPRPSTMRRSGNRFPRLPSLMKRPRNPYPRRSRRNRIRTSDRRRDPRLSMPISRRHPYRSLPLFPRIRNMRWCLFRNRFRRSSIPGVLNARLSSPRPPPSTRGRSTSATATYQSSPSTIYSEMTTRTSSAEGASSWVPALHCSSRAPVSISSSLRTADCTGTASNWRSDAEAAVWTSEGWA